MLTLYNFTASSADALFAAASLTGSKSSGVTTPPAPVGTSAQSPHALSATDGALQVLVAPTSTSTDANKPVAGVSMAFSANTTARVGACTVTIDATKNVVTTVWPDAARAAAYLAAAQAAQQAGNSAPEPRYVSATVRNATPSTSMQATVLDRSVTVQPANDVRMPLATWVGDVLSATLTSAANAAQPVVLTWTPKTATAAPVVDTSAYPALAVHIPSTSSTLLALYSTTQSAAAAAACAGQTTAAPSPTLPPTQQQSYTAELQVQNPSTTDVAGVVVFAEARASTDKCSAGGTGQVCPTDGSSCSFTAGANSTSVAKPVRLFPNTVYTATVPPLTKTAAPITLALPALASKAVVAVAQDVCAAAQTSTQLVVAVFDTAKQATQWATSALATSSDQALPSAMPTPGGGGSSAGRSGGVSSGGGSSPPATHSLIMYAVYGAVMLVVLIAAAVFIARVIRDPPGKISPDSVRTMEMGTLRRNVNGNGGQPRP